MTAPTRRGKNAKSEDAASLSSVKTDADTAANTDAGTEVETKTSTKTEAKRINVAVTPEVVRALELVIENEQVSLTEAVRRLIGYGDFIYRAVKEDQAEVLVRKGDSVREIVLL